MDTLLKNIWVAILVILLTIVLIIAGINTSSKVMVERSGYWFDPPVIVNCIDSPYKTSEVQKAVNFWEDLGVETSGVLDGIDCYESSIAGSITISSTGQQISNETLGVTYSLVEPQTREIYDAEIIIFYKKDKVLEHELGHAFGYKHFERDGHIMNPEWQKSGWETFGIVKDKE